MSNLFIKEGDRYLLSAGGTLLIAAEALYGPPEESTDEGRRRAAALMDALLPVAAERGFARRDLMKTMLPRNEASERVCDMAREIDKCLGKDGFEIALKRAGGA